MSRRTLRSLAAAALAVGTLVAVSPRSMAAQAGVVIRGPAGTRASLRLDQLMAPWELESTGLARLSAGERAALEAWLARYTASLRAERGAVGSSNRVVLPGPGVIGAPVPMDTIRPEPGARPAPTLRSVPRRPARIALSADPLPSAFEIVAVYEGGDVIATDDGSLWETYLPDRPSAATWEVGQSIVVRSNPLPRQLSGAPFDVVLVNASTHSRASARYAGHQQQPTTEDGGGR